jgi:dolichol-phosphate mannosyltransferase
MFTGRDDAVLMPVYNEEETVEDVLNAVRTFYTGELIVVDDGSTDATAEKISERDDILIVRHPGNLGYGRSLIDGFQFAAFAGIERLITVDFDGQHEPAHIPQFFEELARGGDIVSGSRYLPGSFATGEAPPDRAEVNARVVERIEPVTGWGLTDAFCGFKAYRMEALQRLELTEDGYGMPMELWAKAHLAGLDVREIPVERIYHDHGRSFGEGLDDPDARFDYYISVWEAALGEKAAG